MFKISDGRKGHLAKDFARLVACCPFTYSLWLLGLFNNREFPLLVRILGPKFPHRIIHLLWVLFHSIYLKNQKCKAYIPILYKFNK